MSKIIRTIQILLKISIIMALLLLSGCKNTTLTKGDITTDPYYEINKSSNINYGNAINEDGEPIELLLDVYQPVASRPSQRPVIIWVHGGGFHEGSKDMGIEVDLAKDMAKRGYVSICINYRLRDNPFNDFAATLEDAIRDVDMACMWVESNSKAYNLSSDRLILAGYSAGSGIVTNMIYGSVVEDLELEKNRIIGALLLAGDAPLYGKPEEGAPPCLIIHGVDDQVMSIYKAELFANQLEQAGINHQLYKMDGVGHDFRAYYDEVQSLISTFTQQEIMEFD